MAHGSQGLRAPSLAGLRALGLALGVLLVLLARQSGVYGLAIGLLAGGMVGLGRTSGVRLVVDEERTSGVRLVVDEEHAGTRRLPVLEPLIGYLVCLWWLGPPSLLTLSVGFWLMGFLELHPLPPVRRWRAAGTRDGLLMGQFMNGIIGLVSLTCLRLTLVPELWSMVR